MAYSPYRQGTILAPVGGKNHLHVVCNNPIYYPIYGCDSILVVNITTVYPAPAHHDPACLLYKGEHPFIVHDSYVYYADAIVWKVPNVVSREQSGELIQHADITNDVFQRVLDGFQLSDFTSGKILKFFHQYCQ